MELSEISRKVKRIKDWKGLTSDTSIPQELRNRLSSTASKLEQILFDCWEASRIDAESKQQIESLERTLEQLSEDIRLQGGASVVE